MKALDPGGEICITGTGCLTPLGMGAELFFEGLLKGERTASRVHRFGLSDWCPSSLAAEVPDFPLEGPNPILAGMAGNEKEADRASPQLRMAWAAAELALRESGLKIGEELAGRTGIFFASSRFCGERMEYIMERSSSGRLAEIMPLRIDWIHPHGTACHLSFLYGINGPCITFPDSCISSNMALDAARLYLKMGVIDVALVVSCDVLSRFQYHSEAMSGILSTQRDPAEAPLPYDSEADGAVPAEGAAALVVERSSDASARGARSLALLRSMFISTQTYPFPPSRVFDYGIREATRIMAARESKHSFDLVVGDGRGIPGLDTAESAGLREALGKKADALPVTGLQGAMGHAGGTNGLLQAITALKAMQAGVAPPIAGLETPGEGCDLDYVMKKPRPGNFRSALSVTHGWGGQHGCLVLERL